MLLPQIPTQLLQTQIKTSELLNAFPSTMPIPVFNQHGACVAKWSENEFLQILSQMPKPDKTPSFIGAQSSQSLEVVKTNQDEEAVPSANDNFLWMSELLLKKIPWPLYACDLKNRTLFFNHLFEEKILPFAKFRNSLKVAENYMTEVTRSLLATAFTERSYYNRQQSFLNTYDSDIQYLITMQNLEENSVLHGYLFIFQSTVDSSFKLEMEYRWKQGEGLGKIIDDVETRIITDALERHGQNLSHTAEALKIKRSTLQSRIKHLEKINKNFKRVVTAPVRRKTRQTKSEKELGKIVNYSQKETQMQVKNTAPKTALKSKNKRIIAPKTKNKSKTERKITPIAKVSSKNAKNIKKVDTITKPQKMESQELKIGDNKT